MLLNVSAELSEDNVASVQQYTFLNKKTAAAVGTDLEVRKEERPSGD